MNPICLPWILTFASSTTPSKRLVFTMFHILIYYRLHILSTIIRSTPFWFPPLLEGSLANFPVAMSYIPGPPVSSEPLSAWKKSWLKASLQGRLCRLIACVQLGPPKYCIASLSTFSCIIRPKHNLPLSFFCLTLHKMSNSEGYKGMDGT